MSWLLTLFTFFTFHEPKETLILMTRQKIKKKRFVLTIHLFILLLIQYLEENKNIFTRGLNFNNIKKMY